MCQEPCLNFKCRRSKTGSPQSNNRTTRRSLSHNLRHSIQVVSARAKAVSRCACHRSPKWRPRQVADYEAASGAPERFAFRLAANVASAFGHDAAGFAENSPAIYGWEQCNRDLGRCPTVNPAINGRAIVIFCPGRGARFPCPGREGQINLLFSCNYSGGGVKRHGKYQEPSARGQRIKHMKTRLHYLVSGRKRVF